MHGLLAVPMVAAMLAHIYIGTVGMEGAMGVGQVDATWAKEHHALWVEQELAKAREAVIAPGAKAAGPSWIGSRTGLKAAASGRAA